MSNALQNSEEKELEACEQVIANGLNHFVQVGNALIRIRDLKLYRATHSTFASYCKEKWSMGKSRAYQIIEAAQVVGVLPVKASEMSTIVDKPIPAPTCEATVRPLTQLEPEQQPVAYARAVEIAGGHAPTAKQVEEAVEEIKPKKRLPAFRPDDGMLYAKMAINQLQKIDPRDTQRTEAFDYVIAWINKQN